MHARTSARDTYGWDDGVFRPRGDIAFPSPVDAQRFSDAVNRKGGHLVATEVMAMALLHEVSHRVIDHYRRARPQSFERLIEALRARLGDDVATTLAAFLGTFPPPAVYRRQRTVGEIFATEGPHAQQWATEELLLVWLANQNPAYDPVREIVTDADLPAAYRAIVETVRGHFAAEGGIGPGGESLVEVLLAPILHAPHSALAQLAWILENWAGLYDLEAMGLYERLALPAAIRRDEERDRGRGPGPGTPVLEPMRFAAHAVPEERRYSLDTDWMPRVVMLAKSVYVWLGQLSRDYGKPIERLDQIPDEELARIADRGFSGLWLIGLFERSRASRRIKQMRGDPDALASAYALQRYDVAAALGGEAGWRDLRDRAARVGVRLAADMVPNHVAIDADWVMQHPEWFLQTSTPPYPNYRFAGQDLSEDERVGVYIEDGYWNKTDAAVVFKRLDRWSGGEAFIYHGNDGTSMPWNDTAQLDYTKPEVRWAVIQTILHVARMFPIIRFDAAMTLAKRHYQRLWFPLPGHGSDIPSRAAHAMTQEELDARMPVELWREVVDTVAREAPGTLLLAEAFWLMEGYFVRTLGMHRVYNSAFMNMLKREENAKYRETIKNVLDFDPHILERFVNFMSNPDEETAIEQFGDGDKYFGVSVLLATLPGLPMFAHGQIEGYREKYGMEYARAKWDERPVDWLVARHEREVFPLLRRRHLWSGVACFAMYDFETEGAVDENVFAYSNRAGNDRGLVVFHNRWGETRGRVRHGVPARGEDGTLYAKTLTEALALPVEPDAYVVFRDALTGLEWMRGALDLAEHGLGLDLRAFTTHVFVDFRVFHDSAVAPWSELARTLGGRPVPSMERALAEVRWAPLHHALAVVLHDEAPAAKAIDALASGIAETCAREGRLPPGPEAVTTATRASFPAPLTLPSIPPASPAPFRPGTSAPPAVPVPRATAPTVPIAEPAAIVGPDRRILHAWACVRAAIDLYAPLDPEATPVQAIDRMALDRPLHESFAAREATPEAAGTAAQAALLLAASAPDVRAALREALDDPRARAFLHVHASEGVEWLNKERWETLVRLLELRAPTDAPPTPSPRAQEALPTPSPRAQEALPTPSPRAQEALPTPSPRRGEGGGEGPRKVDYITLAAAAGWKLAELRAALAD